LGREAEPYSGRKLAKDQKNRSLFLSFVREADFRFEAMNDCPETYKNPCDALTTKENDKKKTRLPTIVTSKSSFPDTEGNFLI
jgi:hypothetical protein